MYKISSDTFLTRFPKLASQVDLMRAAKLGTPWPIKVYWWHTYNRFGRIIDCSSYMWMCSTKLDMLHAYLPCKEVYNQIGYIWCNGKKIASALPYWEVILNFCTMIWMTVLRILIGFQICTSALQRLCSYGSIAILVSDFGRKMRKLIMFSMCNFSK